MAKRNSQAKMRPSGNGGGVAPFVPHAKAQPQKHVHSHDRPGFDLAHPRAQLARGGPCGKACGDTFGGGVIVAAKAGRVDEFGFVDDPIDFLVSARKGKEGGERARFAVDHRRRARQRGGDMVAHLPRHVGHQRAKDRVL